MSVAGTGRRGAAALLVTRVASFAVTGAASVVFARVLQPAQFGVYAAAQSVVAMVLLIQLLGLDQLFLQQRLSDDELDVGTTQVVVAATVLVALAAGLWPGLSTPQRWCVLLLGAAGVLELLKTPWLLRPQRDLRFGVRARREALTRVARVVLLAGLVFAVHSAVALAGVGLVLAVLLLLPTEGRLVLDRRVVDPASLRRLAQGLPYAVSGIFYTAYFTIDASLLASLRPAQDVAYYRAAYNLVLAAVVFPIVLNNDILRPRLYAAAGAVERRRLVRDFGALSLGLGLVVSLLLLLLRHPLIQILYGDAYRPAERLLGVLALALPFHYLTSLASNVLIARQLVRRLLVAQAALAVLNVAGNLVLIPRQGLQGAAVMTLVTEAAGTVLCGALLLARTVRRG